MRSIRRQVQSIESNRQKNLLDDGNNNNSLFSEERRCQFQEEDWEVLGDDWREDLDFLRQVADKAKKAINVEIWNYYDDEDLDEASDVSSWQNNQHSRSLSQPTSVYILISFIDTVFKNNYIKNHVIIIYNRTETSIQTPHVEFDRRGYLAVRLAVIIT